MVSIFVDRGAPGPHRGAGSRDQSGNARPQRMPRLRRSIYGRATGIKTICGAIARSGARRGESFLNRCRSRTFTCLQ
jgi:hypothetical protein